MAITVVLPAAGGFTVSDIMGVTNFVAVDATVTSFGTTSFSGIGTYNGNSASFTANGSGFTAVSGNVTGGTVDSMAVTVATMGTMQFTTMNIDMAVFGPIIVADNNRTNPTGIEDYLLGRAWDVTLGNNDDILPRGSTTTDGVAFNPRMNDIIRGLGGNDNLFAGDGNDTMLGGVGDDKLDGGKGGDILRGGNGNDTLIGSNGGDTLFGDGGRDKIVGGAGNDDLTGGKGRDVMIGGTGNDDFHFKTGHGKNVIKDFDATNNLEDIDLKGVKAITGFHDLMTHHVTETGGNVIIDDHHGLTIKLVNVALADLGHGDFLF